MRSQRSKRSCAECRSPMRVVSCDQPRPRIVSRGPSDCTISALLRFGPDPDPALKCPAAGMILFPAWLGVKTPRQPICLPSGPGKYAATQLGVLLNTPCNYLSPVSSCQRAFPEDLVPSATNQFQRTRGVEQMVALTPALSGINVAFDQKSDITNVRNVRFGKAFRFLTISWRRIAEPRERARSEPVRHAVRSTLLYFDLAR